MKEKLIALGIISMFLLVGSITTSANNDIDSSVISIEKSEGIEPTRLIDKHIIGEGQLGIALSTGTFLIALPQQGTSIHVVYYYYLLPTLIIERNVSFAILIGFDGILDQNTTTGTFSFEGTSWLNVML